MEEKEDKFKVIRIIISLVLFILSFFPFIKNNEIVYLIICIVAYLIIGYDVLINAFKGILEKEIFNEFLLMTIATIGSFILKEFQEAVAVMVFYQIGETLQDMAIDKSKDSISKLIDIRPEWANLVLENKEIKKVNPSDVKVGDIILVKVGEKIPVDGIIIEGSSTLNTLALTGESLPKDVNVNDKVLSGCINMSQVLYIKTTNTYENSTVAKILDLVENSDKEQAKSEKFITKFSKIYTPIVVLLAVLLALIPSLITKDVQTWVQRALIFLVISCPCALVLSIPLSFFSGIGSASKNGILIKGSIYLEALAKAEIVAFDKTGTLTKGNFMVSAIHPTLITKEELLEIAAILESYSNHPISKSIREAYKKVIDKSKITDVEEMPGYGIKGKMNGKNIYVGNDKLMTLVHANWHNCHRVGTLIHVAIEDEYVGHIVIADEIKNESKKAIEALNELGIRKTVMLTGDKNEVAVLVSNETGVDELYAELLPNEKVEKVKELMAMRTKNHKLIYAGDGINDAPVSITVFLIPNSFKASIAFLDSFLISSAITI